jgi:hypothetical protein
MSMSLERNITWLNRDTYWLSTVPQGNTLWDGQRKYRLTASNFGIASGHSTKFKTPSQLADEMAGIIKIEIPEENRLLMSYGTKTEPLVRKWYENKFKTTVKEVGLAVWKENPALGCSTDGIVLTKPEYCPNGILDTHTKLVESDLLIEIKSVQKMYGPLKEHTARIENGFIPPRYYHDHIWPSHYDQIQGNLAIMNKKACDYIVYCAQEDNVFRYRVEYNPDYWKYELLPKLLTFVSDELNPRLEKLGLSRQDIMNSVNSVN